MESLSELLPFLENERDDVKLMAAEAISQTAADPAAAAGLLAVPGMLKQLLQVSGGKDEAAVHAAAALVNLCAEEDARPKLLAAGAVDAAVAGITSAGPPDRVQYSCMLLANLTQSDEGRAELVRQGTRLHELLRLFGSEKEGSSTYAHLALAFTHVFALPEGRRALLLGAPKGQPSVASVLCRALRSAQSERRVGAARALRNLCFEAQGEGGAALLEAVDELVVALALGLAVTDGGASSPWPDAELYSAAELDAFSSELRELLPRCGLERTEARPAAAGAQPTQEELDAAAASEEAEAAEVARMERAKRANPFVEPEAEAREAATEALLLLAGATRGACAMQTHGLYPLLRQSHFVEWHEPTREANANLVRAARLLKNEPEEQEEEERVQEVD